MTWTPVCPQWGSAVYVKSEHPRALELPDFNGWVVGVELIESMSTSKGNKVRLFSVHAPTCNKSYSKVVGEILDMIQDNRDGCDLLIGGDFNLTISRRHETEERKNKNVNLGIQGRLNEFGLVNCWQTMHPNVPVAQTLRWDRDPEPKFHCDGIFIPKSWASRLVSCEVLWSEEWVGLSDHNPIVATLTEWSQ